MDGERNMPQPFLVTIIRAICPGCGGESHFPEWEPRNCPHCGAGLMDYTPSDLRAEDKVFELKVNPLSGEPVMMEAS